ncbi:hypothetical protein GZ78_19450 [Endozoicomonas numazuensis]|uniref:Uncharacterized protein n=1 Tax=Endozoicomonas numazuensis TaxID=1137799 RepID=A0A081NEG8_9GAMM|nr:hypothetical protein GZ78_19450 [Endozoicomonas numazuensis]
MQVHNSKYPLQVYTESSPSGYVKVKAYISDSEPVQSARVRIKTDSGRVVADKELEAGETRFLYPVEENRVTILVQDPEGKKGRSILTYGQAFPGRESGHIFNH